MNNSGGGSSSSTRSKKNKLVGSVILLNPLQSIKIHGWWNPKRTLSWDDIVSDDSLDVVRLVEEVGEDSLKVIQPDIYEWINKKYVSYEEVPYMTCFPLDPIVHLNGDISTLVTYKYRPEVLGAIGMTYTLMKDSYHLNPKWMAMLDFTLSEWLSLGMSLNDVERMSEKDSMEVFGTCLSGVKLSIGMGESFPNHSRRF